MRRLLALTLILLLSACATPPSPRPSVPEPPPTASPASTVSAAAPAATAVPVAPPSPPPVPDFTTVSTLTSSDWRSGELFLLSGFQSGIRHDADVDFSSETCQPRRDDLPVLASDGVECELSTGPAERVGAYLFPNDKAARAAYETRLQEHGLGWDDNGGCPFDSITPSVPVAFQPRAACFVNASGFANLRIYWPGQSVVIGVLGRNASIPELAAWASMLPAGQEASDVPDPWLGGIGAPVPFEACVDAPAVTRVHSTTSLTYEVDAGNGGIWITDPSGDETRRLSTHAEGPRNLSTWSPDGRTLAYMVSASSGGEIWLTNPDDGAERRLATTGHFAIADEQGEAPVLSWSPDGRRLAYTTWRNLGAETDPRYGASAWSVDIESGDKARIASGVVLDWSPDSTRVLVRLSGSPLEYPHDVGGPIVVHDLDTGAQALLGQGIHGAWSHDCRYVMVSGGWRQPGIVVHPGVAMRPRLVVDGQVGRWSPVSDDLAVVGDGLVWRVSVEPGDALRLGAGGEPAWSDDGSRLAYVSSEEGDGLVTIDADGSGRRVVASDKYPLGRLSWSPDGRYVVSYHELIMGETCGGPKWGFIVAADGSGIRTLPSPYHVAWRPTDPSPPDELTADAPPKRSEGCGG